MSCYAYVFVYTYWCVITKYITDNCSQSWKYIYNKCVGLLNYIRKLCFIYFSHTYNIYIYTLYIYLYIYIYQQSKQMLLKLELLDVTCTSCTFVLQDHHLFGTQVHICTLCQNILQLWKKADSRRKSFSVCSWASCLLCHQKSCEHISCSWPKLFQLDSTHSETLVESRNNQFLQNAFHKNVKIWTFIQRMKNTAAGVCFIF